MRFILGRYTKGSFTQRMKITRREFHFRSFTRRRIHARFSVLHCCSPRVVGSVNKHGCSNQSEKGFLLCLLHERQKKSVAGCTI